MQNHVHYVAIGDSITEGVGASDHSSCFSAKFFHAIRQTPECQYVNLGRSGMSSEQLLRYIEQSDIRDQLEKATDITISTGGIDLINTYKGNGGVADYIVTIRNLKRNVNQLLRQITQRNPSAHVMIMGIYNPGLADHPLYPLANMLLPRINNMYERLASQYRSRFVDLFGEFLNKPHLLADEIHPNDLGYEVIANLFVEKSNRKLART